MDKSWIIEDRTSDVYINGVEQFLRFAVRNEEKHNEKHSHKRRKKHILIRCPCFDCDNVPPGLTIGEVISHLFHTGFDPGYFKWVWHGEDVGNIPTVEDAGYTSNDEDVGETEFLKDEEVQMEDVSCDATEFEEEIEDAEKPLYEGCPKSKLEALAELYDFKAGNGLSVKGFSELLDILKTLLPEENELPKSTYEAKKTLKTLGMGYEKIHACSNDCILYRKNYKDWNACPVCKSSRWMPNNHPNKRSKGVPAKVMWYFSPIPRFERLYKSVDSKDLMWHSEERTKDSGVLRHPADSPAWKPVDDKWPEFAEEPRNLRLGLSADGVNPHSSFGSGKHSCWPVMMTIYNLPPSQCMKKKYIMLTMLIPGHPGKDIDVYLAPLIEDLKRLWDVGIEVYDSYKQQKFILKAVLLWTINDFPSYGDLSGCATKGYKDCPVCSEKTYSTWLKHSRNVCYTGHRRFLPSKHRFRHQMKAFNGQQEFAEAPNPLSGEEILYKVHDMQNTFGKKNKKKRVVIMKLSKLKKSKKSKKNQVEDHVDTVRKRKRSTGNKLNNVKIPRVKHHVEAFQKKSVFFELEYWKYLLVRHMLDVMHIEKNVSESIIGTILDVAGKSKDGLNSRLDLKDMGIKEELQPRDLENGTYLPPACFKLSKEEKIKFCATLSQLKVPSGYSSSLRNCVSMDDLKLQGLKSHDYHVLMQQLLPVAIRSVLPKKGAEASIFSHQNHSAVSKPSSSAGSSPKVVKDSEDKDVDDEINQMKRNIGIGKGKSCIMFLETSGSSVAVAKGKVFRSKSSDMLHNVRIGKGNVRILVEEALKPSFCLPIPLKGEEEIFLVGDAERYHVAWPKKLVIKGEKAKKLMKG